jgi:cyclophilin family peptidyl-prolyl cis-trans isomerase
VKSKHQTRDASYAPTKTSFSPRWILRALATLGLLVVLFLTISCDRVQDGSTSAIDSANTSSQELSSMTQMQWSSPPEMLIDQTKTYHATLQTEKGDIVLQLFAAEAPNTVNNFVFLSRSGYYDGVTFHRVIPDFMAQSGDPTGDGTGGPGYTFDDEVGSGLTFDRPGLLAMANAGPGTNGSQFFITYTPTPHLTGMHTIFGEVLKGMDVAHAIPPRNPQSATSPGMVIKSVTINED